MFWIDLARQVFGKLPIRFGGTGNDKGYSTGLIKTVQNRTGSTIARGTLVKFIFPTQNNPEITPADTENEAILGVVVGYFSTDNIYLDADCPDLSPAAVMTQGTTNVLIASAVTKGQYAYVSATDGQAKSSASSTLGYVFGVFDKTEASGSARVTIAAGLTTVSGAPAGADYLVGTAQGALSGEIVVGAIPGGELGGTWASPTVDATHSGSAHHSENHASRHYPDGADEIAGHYELLMTPGVTGPPVPLTTTAEDDFIYGWIPD